MFRTVLPSAGEIAKAVANAKPQLWPKARGPPAPADQVLPQPQGPPKAHGPPVPKETPRILQEQAERARSSQNIAAVNAAIEKAHRIEQEPEPRPRKQPPPLSTSASRPPPAKAEAQASSRDCRLTDSALKATHDQKRALPHGLNVPVRMRSEHIHSATSTDQPRRWPLPLTSLRSGVESSLRANPSELSVLRCKTDLSVNLDAGEVELVLALDIDYCLVPSPNDVLRSSRPS